MSVTIQHGNASGSGTAATQTDQETATSTTVFVSPGVQQFHPSAAKAWVRFTGITTTASSASYNVSSLTDNGVGDTTINFTTAFSSGNYGYSASVGDTAGGAASEIMAPYAAAPTGSAFRVTTFTSGFGATKDAVSVGASFFGDQ